MLKKMNSFYQMLFVVFLLLSFNSLQANDGLSSIDFGVNGKTTETFIVGTPKNWNRTDDVEKPFHYKFIHEKGDCEAYLVFSCYQSRPSRRALLWAVNNCMKKLFGQEYLNLAEAGFKLVDDNDDIVAFYFGMPKDDKLEDIVVFSALVCDSLCNCIITNVYIFKKFNLDLFEQYHRNIGESIRFVRH